MAGVIWSLQGLAGLEAAMERASDSVRVHVGRANRDTAFAIQHRAQATVRKVRGDLAANIAVQGKGWTWRVGILDVALPSRGGGTKNPFFHQNPWVYGQAVEGLLVIEHGNEGFRAHPFMRPAASAEDGPYEGRIQAVGIAIASSSSGVV
jgi:hypothetical protein